MININKYYLVLGHIIKMLSSEVKNKTVKMEECIKILKGYLQSIEES